ncbi:MAG: hypothetical protein IJG39_10310 [Synergistaceae bacterium]|nr:hypothetical protein [Synergistaceae bacterium]
MKSELLERLSQEKPEHSKDEIREALKRGYSVKQIIQALTPEMSKTEIRQGKIWYSGMHETFEVPYTYETFNMLCRILFE